MFKGSASRVAIRIASRNVVRIQFVCLLNQLWWRPEFLREFLSKACDHVTPTKATKMLIECLHCFLCSLVSGKAGPLMPPSRACLLGKCEVPFCLLEPVCGALCHAPVRAPLLHVEPYQIVSR